MPSFKSLEQAGWTEKAGAYDTHFASIANQAAAPLLDSVGEIAGREVLDICCGTGDLATAASARGGRVSGIDFAPTMIDVARRKTPAIEFRVGDAEALPFPDACFDIAFCSFGLWHLADPDRALAEAARVLRKGGAFAYTTWRSPQEGFDMFGLLLKAVAAHGSMEVELPPSPPPFRFADPAEAMRVLADLGFKDIAARTAIALWTGSNGDELLDVIYKSIVRAPMLIDAQPPQVRDAIKRDIRNGAEAMKKDGKITLRWPYLLVSGRLG